MPGMMAVLLQQTFWHLLKLWGFEKLPQIWGMDNPYRPDACPGDKLRCMWETHNDHPR
jgi:hypothetical protein